MSGITIDVDTRADSAKRDINDLNKDIAKLVRNSQSFSFANLNTSGIRNLNKDLQTSLGGFRDIKTEGVKSFNTVDKSANSLVGTLGGLKAALVGIGSAFLAVKGVNAFNKAADDLTNVQNRLNLSVSSAEELLAVQAEIYKVTKETRSALADTASIYVDFSQALSTTSTSQDRILNVVKTIQQSAALSGSSVEALKGAMVQLTQGISSGTLRGEELNSVLEQMKYLGTGLQRELGKNAGELRKFAEDGKLTTELLLTTIEKLGTKTDADFKKRTATVEVSAQQLRQSLSLFTGEVNQFFGSANRLSSLLLRTADSVDEFASRLRLGSLNAKLALSNYIRQFDTFDAFELTVKGLLNFEISPFEAYSKYRTYKQINDNIKAFKDSVNNRDLSFVENVKIGLDIFTVASTSAADTGKISSTIQKWGAAASISFEKASAAILEKLRSSPLTDFFVVMVENWIRLLPILRGPIQTIESDLRQFASTWKITMGAVVSDAIVPIARSLEGLNEILTGFVEGDNRLERAWVNLFDSKSVIEFTANLRELNTVRRDIKYNDVNFIANEELRNIRGATFLLEDLLVYLNLVDNSLLNIRDLRLDRLIKYFSALGSVTKRVYTDIFATTLEPFVAKLFVRLRSVLETLFDAVVNTFTASNGEKAAAAIFSGFVSTFKRLVSGELNLVEAFDGSNLDAALSNAKLIFEAFTSFVKGFLTQSIESAVDVVADSFVSKLFSRFVKASQKAAESVRQALYNAIDSIPSSLTSARLAISLDIGSVDLKDVGQFLTETLQRAYTKASTLLKQIESLVQNFAKRVKYYFWDIYDKVVGNSYWPDMIDGVVDYASGLFKAESLVLKFTSKVGALFKDIFEKVSEQSKGFGEALTTVFEEIGKINFSNIADAFAKNIGGSIVAAFFLLGSNASLKLAAYSYFLNLFNGALLNAAPGLGFAVASVAGGALGGFAESFTEGLVRSLDLALEALPGFISGFLAALNPLPDTFKSIFGNAFDSFVAVFPVIGTLLKNNLIWGLVTAAGILSVLNKDLRKTFTSLVFGKNARSGRQDGIADYLSAILPNFLKGFEGGLVSTIASPKLVAAAAAAFGSAIFDSISMLEAAQVGVPLLAFGLLGKEGGGKLIRDFVGFLELAAVYAYRFIYQSSAKFSGANSLLTKVLGTPFSIADWFRTASTKGSVESAGTRLWGDIKAMYGNLRDNTEAYSKGKMSLWEAMVTPKGFQESLKKNFNDVSDQLELFGKPGEQLDLFGTSLKGGEKPSKIDLKSRLKEFSAPLLDFQIAGRSIGTIFNSLVSDIKLSTQRLVLALKSANISESVTQMASSLFGGLAMIFSNAFKLISSSLTGLLGVLKNKFVLFFVLAAGLTSFASAASDASSAVSLLGSELSTTLSIVGSGVSMVLALAAAFKAVSAFKGGVSVFKDIRSGKLIPEGISETVERFKKLGNAKLERDAQNNLDKFKLNRAKIVSKEILKIEQEALNLASNAKEISARKDSAKDAYYRQIAALDARDKATAEMSAGADRDKAQQKSAQLRERLAARYKSQDSALTKQLVENANKLQILSEKKKNAKSDAFFSSLTDSFATENRKKLLQELEANVVAFEKDQKKSQERLSALASASSPLAAGLMNVKFFFSDIFDKVLGKSGITFDKVQQRSSAFGRSLKTALGVSDAAAAALNESLSGVGSSLKQIAFGNVVSGFKDFALSAIGAARAAKGVAVDIGTTLSLAIGTLASKGLSLRAIFTSLAGVMVSLKAGLLAVKTFLSAKLFTPLLALLLPFAKIAAIGSAIVGTVGVLGLYLFGPDDTNFVTKLEWAYDKIRSIFGLQAKSGVGRKGAIDSLLGTATVDDKRVSEMYSAVDFDRLSEKQFEAYTEVADQLRQLIDDLNKLEIKQGGLTEAQKSERSKALSEFQDINLRFPKAKTESLAAGGAALTNTILAVDNSIWAITKRMLLTVPAFQEVKKAVKEVEGAVSGFWQAVKLVAVSILGGIAGALAAAAIGSAFGGPIGAFAGFLIGGILTALYKGLQYFFPETVSRMRAGFDSALKTLDDFLGRFKSNLDIFVSNSITVFKSLFDRFRVKPSADAQRLSQEALDARELAVKFEDFIPPATLKQLKDLQKSYEDSIRVRDQLRGRDFNPSLDKSREAYNAKVLVADTNFYKLRSQYLSQMREQGEKAENAYFAKQLKTNIKAVTDAAKELANVDFGKDGEGFIGSESDLRSLEDYLKGIRELNKQLNDLPTVEERRENRLQKQLAAANAANVKEVSEAFATQEGAFKKISEVSGFSESAIRNAPNISFKLDDIKPIVKQIGEVENAINSAKLNGGAGVDELRRKLSGLKQDLQTKIQGSTFIDDINASLRGLNLPEVKPEMWQRIDKAAQASILSGVANAQSEADLAADKNLSAEERNKRRLSATKASAEVGSNIQSALISSLKDLNKNAGESTAIIASALNQEVTPAIGRSVKGLQSWNSLSVKIAERTQRISDLQQAATLSGAPVDQKELSKTYREIFNLQEQLGKLSDSTVFSFESMKSSLSNFGIELDAVSFSGLEASQRVALVSLTRGLELIQKRFSEKSAETLAGDEVASLLKEQASRVEAAAKIIVSSTSVSGKSLFEKLSNAGIESVAALGNFAVKGFLEIEAKLQILKSSLNKTFKLDDQKSLDLAIAKFREILTLERQRKRAMEDAAATFETSLASVNEVFKTSLSGGSFAKLGDRSISLLAAAAKDVKRAFEDAVSGPGFTAKVAEDFYSAFEALELRGTALSFFSDYATELRKATYEGVKSGFDRVKSALPNISFDQETFAEMRPEDRRGMATRATGLSMLARAAELPLSPELAAFLNTFRRDDDPVEFLNSFRQKFNEETQNSLDAALGAPADKIVAAVDRVRDAILGKGSPSNAGAVPNESAGVPAKAFAKFEAGDTSEAYRAINQAIADQTVQSDELARGVMSSQARLASVSQSIGSALSFSEVVKLSESGRNRLETVGKLVEEEMNKLKTASMADKPLIQASINTYLESFEDLKEGLLKQANGAKEAGKAFSESVNSTFSDALKSALKGASAENQSVLQTFISTILDGVTKSVIDSFVDGLMSPITGPEGMMKNLGKNVWSFGAGIFGDTKKPGQVSSEGGPALAGAPDIGSGFAGDTSGNIESSFSQLNSTMMKGFGGVIGVTAGAALLQGNGFEKLIGLLTITNSILTLIEVWNAVDAMVPFATGGKVSGPGTGTSDSIPAKLSNGEFVINAKATKKNLPLLEAINSHKFRGFAEGGLVSTAVVSTPRAVNIESSPKVKQGYQQVINLTITGDISRQTKSEIYKMLPSIAEGVNLHNREKGYRV